MTTWRTFIAVELDEHLRIGLQRIQDQLRDRLPARCVRWVRPDGIHLTLKFLGDTPETHMRDVVTAVTRAAAAVEPFAFTVGGIGCFPSLRQPRVVWVGLHEPTGTLCRLRDAVEAEVAPLGFPTERRPFQPHLTLGRVQPYASKSEVREIGEAVAALAAATLGQMSAGAVSYIKSDLRPTGAVYTTLHEAGLAKPCSSP
jgi:2'-5' RNA ligase